MTFILLLIIAFMIGYIIMLHKIQNWLKNVAAKWIWFAIMLPIRIVLGLCFAVAKYMPKTVQLPYKVVKREETDKKWWN